ncbi:ParB/RepB/Spo0J family partition protein [Psychrobacter sp. FDAARGOS_221]|uniref:ParB/RepB/Spo0J family partition protein n=1 Tax=Psychrobacter sp. FDAARGOS_221 TaxID=1975705 RepID=UPI000BB5931A|nr:ParB/RepB/Spo0J family partition protein [Psychrobacter sp. FDAARGOS_221]PNK59720.1 chromosome partitioning protein ParB [Psychrobacter sp. FDAARGOS_221]
MAKKRGLAANRGLDALLGSIKKEKAITAAALRDDSTLEHDEKPDTGAKASVKGTASAKKTAVRKKTASAAKAEVVAKTAVDVSDEEMTLVQMDVERLQAGKYQPRRDMSETALGELASSIKQHGVMQPIVIRPLLATEEKIADTITHEIIAGERRWRAAKLAGQTTIPAIERALSDELAIALALIENIQREDLSVIEQAAALQRFHTEFGMSHAMIAEVVGKARTTVSNLLRLNHLHETVKTYLNDGQLDMGHARALLSLSSEQQPIIAEKIIEASMTVREAEKLVKSILNPQKEDNKQKQQQHAEVEKLNQQLSDYLGATVKLKQKKDGKGSMEIFFHSPEELDALLKHFKS